MTREEITQKVLENSHSIISAGTGVGKTLLALKKADSLEVAEVLVVVPKLAIIDTWKQEIIKWKIKDTVKFTFTAYNSIHKYVRHRWDLVIFDEAHHITERVMDIIREMWFDNLICLSATMKREVTSSLKILFPNIKTFRLPLSEAIENGILPDPKIFLIPLRLNAVDKNECIIKNPKARIEKIIEFSKRKFYRDKKTKYIIPCTEVQYNLDMDEQVEWYKRLAMGGNNVMKTIWLRKAGIRLKWLANKKTSYVKALLVYLKQYRTLTFCTDISQAEELGKNAIHSKKKNYQEILDKFNTKLIKHITGVNILNEGLNLTDCQIGIFAGINSSETMQIQKFGRILRHQEPIIIIPYFVNTREEEIVEKMLVGYNKDLIKRVNFNDFANNKWF